MVKKGKTMIIFSLIRIISISLLSRSFFVVANKFGDIIKAFEVIPYIWFRSIPGLANKAFYHMVFVFLHYLFVKQTVNLKGFGGIGVIVSKYDGSI